MQETVKRKYPTFLLLRKTTCPPRIAFLTSWLYCCVIDVCQCNRCPCSSSLRSESGTAGRSYMPVRGAARRRQCWIIRLFAVTTDPPSCHVGRMINMTVVIVILIDVGVLLPIAVGLGILFFMEVSPVKSKAADIVA